MGWVVVTVVCFWLFFIMLNIGIPLLMYLGHILSCVTLRLLQFFQYEKEVKLET